MGHVPMCVMCGQREVGAFKGGTDEYCSATCAGAARAEWDALTIDADEWEQDGGHGGSHDHIDDADTLTSAGWGTDEDYGYYGEDY